MKCRNVEENTLAIMFWPTPSSFSQVKITFPPPFLRQGDDHGLNLCVQSAGLSTGAEEIGTEEASSPAHHHIATHLTWQQRELCASKDATLVTKVTLEVKLHLHQ